MLIDFRQLFPKYGIKPQAVLHVGANVGEEAPVYDELGIEKVVWVEANPKLMDALRENISKYPRQTAFNFCAGDENKDVVLHLSNNSGQSSSILDLEYHVAAHPEVHYIEDVTVPMMRIDKIFAKTGVADSDARYNIDGCDFLNIDIQGAEGLALKGMGKMLEQFKWAYLEVNKLELYKGCALVQDIDQYLAGFGFTRVETKWAGNTGWGDALYVKQ